MSRASPVTMLLLAVLGAACWRAEPVEPPFEVVRTSPTFAVGGEPMLLNDSVTVYFSAPVNPQSVTEDSVTVLDGQGHQVRGSLRTGPTWVTFVPHPPHAADLGDGSFRPGAVYRLVVAGYPRPDAVRATDGRRLASAHAYDLVMATRGGAPPGLPAPLRPPSTGLPFLLRTYDVPQLLAADAPRLHLHFTLPVLPSTATAAAFRIQLLRNREIVVPRSVRVITSRLDEYPGSTIEIDLGAAMRIRDGSSSVRLSPGDWVSVALDGDRPLTDLAGSRVLAPATPCWNVVAGTSIALLEWPTADGGIVGDDPLLPGFEAVSGTIRPRVRVEAGDGSLGVLRPARSLVLRPGEPFDRGDGVVVVSRGAVFPFLAIDIPNGITVRIDGGPTPVRLLACGGIRIDGTLEVAGSPARLQPIVHGTAVADLLDAAPVALVAAGDIQVNGLVQATAALPSDCTALTVASAARILLAGTLPYNTVLCVEEKPTAPAEPAILGSRGQTISAAAAFTYGCAPGAGFTVQGASPWRQMPSDREGGTLHAAGVDPGLRVGWQQTPPDPVRKGEPDLRPDRVLRVESANDLDRLSFQASAFVRFRIEAEVGPDTPPPTLRDLRISDR